MLFYPADAHYMDMRVMRYIYSGNRKAAIRIFALLLATVIVTDIFTGCTAKGDAGDYYSLGCKKLKSADEEKLHEYLEDLCSQKLWDSVNASDAGNYMMIPMHYAFKAQDDAAVKSYRDMFDSFTKDYLSGGEAAFDELSKVSRLQFLYLGSQYLVLCSSGEKYTDMFLPDLYDIILNYTEKELYEKAPSWKTEDTVEKHLEEVLNGKEYEYHYYSWITDGDLFILAILCDCTYVAGKRNLPVTDEMKKAQILAYEILNSEELNTVTEEDGWLMQVGVMQDYKDYLYAGNTEITGDMEICPREDITWDVSHFRRMAAFLNSYESAAETEEEKNLYRLRRDQLSNQLKKCFVNQNGSWVSTSFMDGTNGVFRYEYHEEGVGLTGYEHSSSIISGWWVLLNQKWIDDVYKDILEGFPYPCDETNPYLDRTTVREQNVYFDSDTAWDNGAYECVVKCAVQLGKR